MDSSTPPGPADERRRFYNAIAAHSMTPLWEVLHALVPPAPNTPCVPAHWPSFEVTLRLATQARRVVTVRWQRADTPVSDTFSPDAVVSPGEMLRMTDLPPNALVLVQAG